MIAGRISRMYLRYTEATSSSQSGAADVDSTKVDQLTQRLSESIETDAEGRQQLKITLPDKESLRTLATTLARLLDP